MIKLTRYSGSKTRLLKYFPVIPADTKRLVEIYGGSMAWVLNNNLPFVVYEINPKLTEMYKWLLSLTDEDIDNLPNPSSEKVDIRTFGWGVGQNTYYQLNVASVVLGQLSSWSWNPKYTLPKEKTKKALPRLREGIIISGDCHTLYQYQDGDYIFIDPPYIKTHANYKIGNDYKPRLTIDLIDRIPRGRWFMTYGSLIPEFSKYNIMEMCVRKVPNIRKGGVVERTEYLFQ